jgi:predicted DNA-binding protein (MmcQ/YjbR family)
MTIPTDLRKVHRELLKFALSYPEAWEDHPWEDDLVAKVRKKIFVFFGRATREEIGIAVKLPIEGEFARSLPNCEPSGYGLGKSGWVNARFGLGQDVPVDMLKEWIDESYRAVAPKTLIKQLDA